MRVLGIDPGLTRCGWGVVDGRPGARPDRGRRRRDPHARPSSTWSCACSSCTPRSPALLREHRPDVVAIERVFTQNNKGTVMGTAQAAGVAALAAAQADRPVAWHTPSEVKAAISGSGRADKDQVTLMVTRVLGLAAAPKPADAADALALAICHVWRGPAQHRLRRRRAAPAASARRSGSTHAAALDGGGGPMIASVQRPGGRGRRPDGAVVEVGGIGLAVQCTPGTIARLQVGEQRPAVDQPGRPRGLAHPLRLRRRRRAPACSSCCRPPTASARGSPRRCWPSTRRARSAARSRWATSRRSCRCPASARRAPSGWSSSCGTGSASTTSDTSLDGPPLPGCRRSPPVAPWRDQLTSALVGLGWSVREADGAVGQLAPVADEQIAAHRHGRGRGPAAAGAAAAGPGMSVALRPAADRRRWPAASASDAAGVAAGRRRGAGRRVGAAAALAGRLHRPAEGRPAARRSCSRAPSGAAGRRTTCCCPARPGWARPASR